MFKRILLCFGLLFGFFLTETEQGVAERQLLLKLFGKNYEQLERPVVNDTEALEVQFGLTLQQIIDVDEKYQVIHCNIWLNLLWQDYRLRWNPLKFNNITVINVPINQIWRPDVLMYNSADEKFDAAFPTNAVIESNGQVKWVPPGMFSSTCNINIQWFPFDDQQCELKFGSWTYDGTKLNLTLMSDSGDISAFIKNGEWTLLGMPAKRNVKFYEPEQIVPWIDVAFYINIRRRALYYTFNLIVPSVMLSSISLLTFMLPPESGEKISLGVTILLSLTVFLLMVAETMPPTSDAIPLIGIYFAATMVMCSLSVIFTVLVLNFHSRRPETHEMPDWVRRGICQWLAWLLRMKRPGHDLSRKGLIISSRLPPVVKSPCSIIANVIEMDDDIRALVDDFRSREYSPIPGIKGYAICRRKTSQSFLATRTELATILKELQTLTNKMREDETNDIEASDWKFAAMVIDRLCLYSFILAMFASTATILLSAPNLFA